MKKKKYIKEAKITVNEFRINAKKSEKKVIDNESLEHTEIKGFQQTPEETAPDKKTIKPLVSKTNKTKPK